MTNKETELLPCPFCGGEARMFEKADGLGSSFYEAQCWDNDCGANVTCRSTCMDEGIKAWNTRTPTPDEIKRLVEMASDNTFTLHKIESRGPVVNMQEVIALKEQLAFIQSIKEKMK